MNPNDPRFRLQVAKASSPSLRMAAAPTPDNTLLTVVGPRQSQAPAPSNDSNPIADVIGNIGKFAAGSNQTFLGGSVRGAANSLNFLTNGFNAEKANQDANNFTKSIGLGTDSTNSALDSNAIAPAIDRGSTAFQVGQTAGTAQKTAFDLGTAVVPGAAAESAISNTLKANEFLQGAGLLNKAGRVIVPAVGGGAVSSAILQAQDPSQNAGDNFGSNAAIDAGVSLLGPAGSIAGRALSKADVGSKVTDFLGKLGFGSKLKTTAKSLADVTDDSGVQIALKKILPELDPQSASDVSKYIASETDPKAIEATLKSLKDGAGDVKGADKPSDLPPEDKAAIEQAGGVPADTTPSSVLHLPDQGVHAKLTPEQVNSLKDEINAVPWSATDRPHLTAGQNVLDKTKEVTLDDIKNLSPNAKTALDNIQTKAADVTPPPVSQADNAITPAANPEAQKAVEVAQTGTADAPITNPEKTTSPDVAQADISAKAGEDAISAEKASQPADIASQSNSYYHGSNNPDIKEFNANHTNGLKQDVLGRGLYLTQDKNYASTYGKNVYETQLEGKNIIDTSKKGVWTDEATLAKLNTELNDRGIKSISSGDGKSLITEYGTIDSSNPGSILSVIRDQRSAGHPAGAIESALDNSGIHGLKSAGKNTKSSGDETVIFNPRNTKLSLDKETATAEEAGHTLAHASDANHPDVQKAIKNVLDALPSAEKNYADKAKVVAKEKATRINQGGQAYDQAGGGESGVRAKLTALKGEHTKSGFEPIDASPEDQKTILDHIENSKMQGFEKLNTQNAVRKIWGANPEKPTPSDVNYIRKYFGEDLANGVQKAIDETPGETGWLSTLKKIAATPRAAMATGDLSGLGRQGAALGLTDPKSFAKNAKASLEYFAKKENFDKAMTTIKNDDSYNLINDKMKVALTGTSGNMEEQFAGENYAEMLPKVLGGGIVRGSDRSYAGLLTGLRFDAAKKVIDAAGGPDEYLAAMKARFGDKADDAMKAYGEAINTLSGRGGKQGGLVDKHMGTLSTTLFAPRLWAANINKINPVWYGKLATRNPAAAKLALRGEASQLAAAGSIMGLAATAGATVEWNPTSSDFGKIKFGNTRYDLLGGQAQNIVLAARLWTGVKTNSETGKQDTLGDGVTTPNRVDLLYQAFENKENPLLSFATRLLKTTDGDGGAFDVNRKDAYGNDFNLLAEGAKLVAPLGIQGIVDTSNDTGNIASGIAMNLPSFIGAGVQTYGSIATKDQGQPDAKGKVTFAGQIKPNMVTDNDGKVMLDAKGKPLTVKIDANSTPLEIKALKDQARRAAYSSEFTRDQSKEDQSLMKLSAAELDGYVKDGTITQDKADGIARLQKGAKTYGGNVDIPGAVRSDVAKNFYKTYNAMDTKDQKAWLSAAPDDNAKTIAGQVNAKRAAGLDELKPSNQLSKAYSDYEKDILSHPEYTKIDLRNKAKAFQTSAYKLNYSSNQQDIYQEGGSEDLKTLMSSGDISKTDLDAAMKMDEQLYNSGLTSSLKFSKKFRGANGYATPDSRTSGGGSSTSVNAHLADYLPSIGKSKGPAVPLFSSRTRSNPASARVQFQVPNGVKAGTASDRVTFAPYRTTSARKLGNNV